MAGLTALTSLGGLTDELRHRLAETTLPASGDVEGELQQIARERLDASTGTDVATPSKRGARAFRHRRQPLVGAYDSPEGFVFGSSGSSRER